MNYSDKYKAEVIACAQMMAERVLDSSVPTVEQLHQERDAVRSIISHPPIRSYIGMRVPEYSDEWLNSVSTVERQALVLLVLMRLMQ